MRGETYHRDKQEVLTADTGTHILKRREVGESLAAAGEQTLESVDAP